MIALLCFFLALLVSPFKPKSRLEAENAALRHQLIVLQRMVRGRVQLTNGDGKRSESELAACRQKSAEAARDPTRPLISFDGGDGEAPEHAVIIRGARNGRDFEERAWAVAGLLALMLRERLGRRNHARIALGNPLSNRAANCKPLLAPKRSIERHLHDGVTDDQDGIAYAQSST
jgi:hypothetical protein